MYPSAPSMAWRMALAHIRPRARASALWLARVSLLDAFAERHAAALAVSGWTFERIFGVLLHPHCAHHWCGERLELEVAFADYLILVVDDRRFMVVRSEFASRGRRPGSLPANAPPELTLRYAELPPATASADLGEGII